MTDTSLLDSSPLNFAVIERIGHKQTQFTLFIFEVHGFVDAAIDPGWLAADGQKILGSKMGSARPAIDVPRIIALYRDGRLKLDELIRATKSARQYDMWLEDLTDDELAELERQVKEIAARPSSARAIQKLQDTIVAAREERKQQAPHLHLPSLHLAKAAEALVKAPEEEPRSPQQ